ncbi:ricin-type beta-trefoil lectin domain protein [Streptomyces sp. NPDC003077]|uniref:RICIN domain-containing protein n=1 Tax=Streptomyces sp. NPDC003077 TaxID=3154443 RepID=UPI0033A50D32
MRRRLNLTMLAVAALGLSLIAPASAASARSAAIEAFAITSDMHGKCLATNGDNVEMQTCRGTGNQLWFREGDKLVNRAERHCLDVRNGELDAPAQAVGDCHGLANQRWNWGLPDDHRIITQVNNQCLSIQNEGEGRDGAGINLRDCRPGFGVAWQKWSRNDNP